MKITLTETQIRQLTPYFDRVQATAALGQPGMLVAQIRWNYRDEKYWMEPGFLPHKHAVLIQEKGQTSVPTPTTPEESTAPRSVQTALDAPTDMPENVALARQ